MSNTTNEPNKPYFRPTVIARDPTLHATVSSIIKYMIDNKLYDANSGKSKDTKRWKAAAAFMFAEPRGPMRNYFCPAAKLYITVRTYCNNLASELSDMYSETKDKGQCPTHDEEAGYEYYVTRITCKESTDKATAYAKEQQALLQSSMRNTEHSVGLNPGSLVQPERGSTITPSPASHTTANATATVVGAPVLPNLESNTGPSHIVLQNAGPFAPRQVPIIPRGPNVAQDARRHFDRSIPPPEIRNDHQRRRLNDGSSAGVQQPAITNPSGLLHAERRGGNSVNHGSDGQGNVGVVGNTDGRNQQENAGTNVGHQQGINGRHRHNPTETNRMLIDRIDNGNHLVMQNWERLEALVAPHSMQHMSETAQLLANIGTFMSSANAPNNPVVKGQVEQVSNALVNRLVEQATTLENLSGNRPNNGGSAVTPARNGQNGNSLYENQNGNVTRRGGNGF